MFLRLAAWPAVWLGASRAGLARGAWRAAVFVAEKTRATAWPHRCARAGR